LGRRVGFMLPKCCNPLCTNSFRSLADGKLFRLENDATLRPSTPTKEYFWLCPSCSPTMTLRISNDGEVITVRMSEQVHLEGDLANRKEGLLLSDVSSDVSIVVRKSMTEVWDFIV